MRSFIELIEIGVPLGMGAYIGCESLRILVESTAWLICSIIKNLFGDDEK